MTHPTEVPLVQTPTAVEAPPVVKFARTKALVKTTFTRVGVPVLIGAAAALVVSKRTDKQDTDEESSSTEE